MNRTLVLVFSAALATLITGCASVANSPNQTVSILARNQNGEDVSDAKCELSNDKGQWYLTTPGSTTVRRSNEDLKILCDKNGHETGRKNLVSEVNGSMYGNILLGGAVGALIDHNNGAAYDYPAVVHINMRLLSKEDIAALAEQAAQKAASEAAARAAAAKAAAAIAARVAVPLAIATGRKPQTGDEWEYLAIDKIYGKRKKLTWRVKSIETDNVVEELVVDGMPSHSWIFNGQPEAVAAPIDMGFIFGQHWDAQSRIPELRVKGELGDCAQRMQCVLVSKVAGMERITIAAGTFDAIRIDGSIVLRHLAIAPSGRVSVWYSERDRRLLKQTASMRTGERSFDETLELQAARAYQ